jgi:large subunit ribosomal protein L24e
VGASLEVIQKKRAEKPEVRDAAREAALRYVCQFYITITNRYRCSIPLRSFELSWPCSEIKERIKKTKDEKKAKKAEVSKSQKTQTKGAVQKGSKGPKLGGGGGKRWKNLVSFLDIAVVP